MSTLDFRDVFIIRAAHQFIFHGGPMITYVNPSSLLVNSSFKYWTSSTISSSENFLDSREVTKTRSLVVNMEGMFWDGAISNRF
jgi:hypothetical protein